MLCFSITWRWVLLVNGILYISTPKEKLIFNVALLTTRQALSCLVLATNVNLFVFHGSGLWLLTLLAVIVHARPHTTTHTLLSDCTEILYNNSSRLPVINFKSFQVVNDWMNWCWCWKLICFCNYYHCCFINAIRLCFIDKPIINFTLSDNLEFF